MQTVINIPVYTGKPTEVIKRDGVTYIITYGSAGRHVQYKDFSSSGDGIVIGIMSGDEETTDEAIERAKAALEGCVQNADA